MLKDSRITARNTRLEPPNEMENSIRIIGTTGRINLKDTTLIAYNTFPRKCEVVVNHNATLNVEGGVHKGLDIVTYKGFTIDRRFDNPFTINILGNINSYMLSITHGNCLGETMLNYRRHNMTLEGDWSAYGVNLWGNLGISMTAPTFKESSVYGKERVPDWFNDNTPAVVMRSVNVAFNLEEIVTAGSAGNRQDVFERHTSWLFRSLTQALLSTVSVPLWIFIKTRPVVAVYITVFCFFSTRSLLPITLGTRPRWHT